MQRVFPVNVHYEPGFLLYTFIYTIHGYMLVSGFAISFQIVAQREASGQ